MPLQVTAVVIRDGDLVAEEIAEMLSVDAGRRFLRAPDNPEMKPVDLGGRHVENIPQDR